jgi:hypothetical protein
MTLPARFHPSGAPRQAQAKQLGLKATQIGDCSLRAGALVHPPSGYIRPGAVRGWWGRGLATHEDRCIVSELLGGLEGRRAGSTSRRSSTPTLRSRTPPARTHPLLHKIVLHPVLWTGSRTP